MSEMDLAQQFAAWRQELQLILADRGERIRRLEAALEEHVKTCAAQQSDIKELIDIMKTVKATKKSATWLKGLLVWLASTATSVVAIVTAMRALGAGG